jgi:hypothetical protein
MVAGHCVGNEYFAHDQVEAQYNINAGTVHVDYNSTVVLVPWSHP